MTHWMRFFGMLAGSLPAPRETAPHKKACDRPIRAVARFADYAVSLLLVTLWGTWSQQLCATRKGYLSTTREGWNIINT